MAIVPEELLKHATATEMEAYRKTLQLQLALSSPLDYAEYVSPGAQRYPHTELLSSLIVKLVTGRLIHPVTGKVVRKMAVSMPPRHGKSYVISDHTPAWAVTRFAPYGFRVGLAAYEAEFAADWGRKARTHVEEHPEFGAVVDGTTRAADRWEILPLQPGGPRAGMNTAGVGGPFTGRGFHLLVVDDPIKNSEWALSQTIRNKQADWLGSTALNRLEPPIHIEHDPIAGCALDVGHSVILVNTRWHEDDLMGRVLKDEPDEWYHLNLKALADADAPKGDALQRQPGEALCPQRYDEEHLRRIQASPTTGGYWFAAQYQGEPNIEGGGIFKRASFRYWGPGPGDSAATHITLKDPGGAPIYVPRHSLSRFSTLDTAATEKQTSDWSVLSTWEVTDDRRLLLIDRVRIRLDSADLSPWVHTNYLRLEPSYIGVESKTFGLTVITQLRRMGVPVRPLSAKGDKVSRALPAGMLIDAGRIYFPEPGMTEWLPEWEHELLQFPNGTHDDQVDTLSYAALEVAVGVWSTVIRATEPEDTSWEARVERHLRNKKRPGRHPELGRIR